MVQHDMIRMANQIASFFNGSGIDVAAKDAAEHINKFWGAHMREQLLAHIAQGGEGLDPTIVKAAGLIKKPKVAA